MTQIKVGKIEPISYVDGPGERSVVFVQGCPLSCRGCQSRHLWSTVGGFTTDVPDLARMLALFSSHVTISGGEPFMQPEALAELVHTLRRQGVEHIIVYSGFTWEELFSPDHPAYPWLKVIFENVDVLVDGRFLLELDDSTITYRGSRNQRPIDVPESLAKGEVVTLDWDDEIEITSDGNLIMPIGFSKLFEAVGGIEKSRQCGQSK